MSTGTALVHPSTARLTPEEQAKGIYTYTSPEELAARQASEMPSAGQALAYAEHAGEAALAERNVGMNPAMAAPYGRKLVSTAKPKQAAPNADHAMQHAVLDLLKAVSDERAYAVLCALAKRFDLEIE